ncbi:MAG: methylmalonyl Co-A mutase-associated GTPase MeaB [Thermodesulfobacteriota bacterium]
MDIVDKVRAGDVRTVSRLIRSIEDRIPEARQAIKALYPFTGRAFVIGLTGAPGAGKSTLTDGLITTFRKQGKSVGVLAVDPTSPFSGGAILGDRVRMQRHAEDPEVYIRSLATRGALGGLCAAVDDAVHVLDAMGKDVILVETVGTGQSEVDIMNNAHSVALILTPGMGDEVQTMKAGIMEIADLFVINKSDRPGGSKLYQELMKVLQMDQSCQSGWQPPVVMVENIADPRAFIEKVEELRDKFLEHRQVLINKDILKKRERRKLSVQLVNSLKESILDPLLDELGVSGRLDRFLEQLVAKEIDPYSLAEKVAGEYLKPSCDHNSEQSFRKNEFLEK